MNYIEVHYAQTNLIINLAVPVSLALLFLGGLKLVKYRIFFGLFLLLIGIFFGIIMLSFDLAMGSFVASSYPGIPSGWFLIASAVKFFVDLKNE